MAFGKSERSIDLPAGPPAAPEECRVFGPRDESCVYIEGLAPPLPAHGSGDQVTTAFQPRVGPKGLKYDRCRVRRPPDAARLPEAAC